MADDNSNGGKPDNDLINLGDDHVVQWSKKLGVSQFELQAALGKVGPKVADVRRFLRK